ncbi:O-antigen ligase family protein [Macellibacteroides fermentans]|uniref:O-antigen ligase family protein n=1 Tax=Macellibacteroides fermentans TaxID=879969 RepID=UPI00406CB8B2
MRFLIFLFFFIASKCFYLFTLPSVYSLGSNVQLEAIIAILMFLFAGIFVGAEYKKIVLFWAAFVFCDAVFTIVFHSEQAIYKTFSTMFSYLILLGYFPMVYFCRRKKNYRLFIKAMTVFSLITATAILVYSYVYNSTGQEILSFSQAYKSFERTGNVRIYYVLESYIRVSQVVSLGWVLQNRCETFLEKLVHILNYLIVFAGIIYVDQSRYYLLAVVCISIYLILKSKNKYGKWIVIGLVAAIVGVYIHDVFVSFVSSALKNDSSMRIRTAAIDYFLSQAVHSPLFGTGLLSPSGTDIEMKLYVYGPRMAYYQDDVGIFGFMAGFGLVGLCWYLYLVWNTYKMGRSCKGNLLFHSLFIYMCMCSFTMLWMNKQRIVGMLIALVIFSCEYKVETGVIKI